MGVRVESGKWELGVGVGVGGPEWRAGSGEWRVDSGEWEVGSG